jgi:hypothetical protein
MGFLGLCSEDALVTTLRDTFNANIIRMPEERIQPLSVIAVGRGKTSFAGSLGTLLRGDNALALSSTRSRVATLSGRQSQQVDLELGLQILSGFLNGFGLPSAAISPKFQGATKVAFSFSNVSRIAIDLGELGRALHGRRIDLNNPVAAIFVLDWECLIIDSTITSRDFTISIFTDEQRSFHLDIDGIQQIVGDASIGAEMIKRSERSITFRGQQDLAFAFTCRRVILTQQGEFNLIEPDTKNRVLNPANWKPEPLLLNNTPGMLSWDE